jgi:hypothetical protein
MKDSDEVKRGSNQLVGNIGLYYICYELSKSGWNCLPTSRNAKGIDIVVYSQNAKRTHTIQAKSLSRKNPVPFGTSANLMADFLIICTDVRTKPEIYILSANEVQGKLHKGVREERISYWLQPPSYEGHKDRWDKIGEGFDSASP